MVIDLDINEILGNPALLEIITKKIVDEVLKVVRNQPKTALVCFSGAMIGFQTALDNLVQLKAEKGWEYKVYLSDAALGIFDTKMIMDKLGVDKIHSSQTHTPQRELWEEVDGVIIASATINTVAKLAVGICDTEMLTIINHAIMAGKPIVLAADGACPDNKTRAKIGMGKSPAGYREMLRGNLKALTSYGVDVIAADDLYDICLDTPAGEAPEVKETAAPVAPAANAPVVEARPVVEAAPAVEEKQEETIDAAQVVKAIMAATSNTSAQPEKPYQPGAITRMALSAKPVVTPVEVEQVLDADPFKEDPILTKRIISRVDIINARPSKVVKVSADSIVTDYAKEAAAEFGMTIEVV